MMEMRGELLARLVSDLPKMGGWPRWAVECILHRGSCKAMFYDEGGRFNGYPSFPDIKFEEEALVERIVYREMYEAALAARKQEWDGEGLPPVGAEVECICNDLSNEHKESLLGHILYSGEYTILKTYKTNNQHHVPVESVFKTKSWAINPIRSEADKKRAEGVIALSRVDPLVVPFEYVERSSDGSLIGYFWYELYDAIAAGKIQHIRID